MIRGYYVPAAIPAAPINSMGMISLKCCLIQVLTRPIPDIGT
jgi:hypothetical protein